MTQVSFSWSTRREGNSGFVLETGPQGHRAEFGPMPAHIVPAFVQSRRRIVALQAAWAGALYVDPGPIPDYSFLAEDPKGPPQ